jgi:SUN domain-containing protein 1/2
LNQHEEEEEGMANMAVLSFTRIFGWLFSCFKTSIMWLFSSVTVDTQKSRKSQTALLYIAGFVGLSVVLYAMAQLDLRIARGIGSSFLSTPLKRSKPVDIAPILQPKDMDSFNRNFSLLKERILSLELALNEAKAMAMGAEELTRSTSEAVQAKLQFLIEKDLALETRLADINGRMLDLGASLTFPESNATKELASSLQDVKEKFKSTKIDMEQMKEQLSAAAVRNLIREEIGNFLPETLLVRKGRDGSVIIDSALMQTLHEMFQTRQSGLTEEGSFGNVNLKVMENMLNGKLSQIEHSLVNREELMDLISKRLAVELPKAVVSNGPSQDMIVKLVDGKLSDVELRMKTRQLSRDEVAKLIQQEIQKNQQDSVADGVGMADFALQTMGSRVVASGTSPSFHKTRGGIADFIIGTRGKPAKTALSPDNSLGNCWAFPGDSGTLTVALGEAIVPSHFSIDHVPSSLPVDRSSAPRRFQVFGLENLMDGPVLLGEFEYRLEGPAVQTFSSQYILSNPIRYVRLVVTSNHGKADYTCLYRFRVHATSDMSILLGDLQ